MWWKNFRLGLLAAFLVVAANRVPAALYFHHNNQLRISQMTTGANQHIGWRQGRKPFGETTLTIDTKVNPLKFPEQNLHGETGLQHNFHRDYDPMMGKYIESASIDSGGGVYKKTSNGGDPLLWLNLQRLVKRRRTFSGSISNESRRGIPTSGIKRGRIHTEVVPPGTPGNPGRSTPGIDWDFAWINCQCWKIGPGELDIGVDGFPKLLQIKHGPVSGGYCIDIVKPRYCSRWEK